MGDLIDAFLMRMGFKTHSLEEVVNGFAYLSQDLGDKGEIFAMGHSLGGQAAGKAANYLTEMDRMKVILRTIGSPLAVNKNAFEDVENFVNNRDFIIEQLFRSNIEPHT